MPEETSGLFGRESARRWAEYAVKAVVLFILLLALSQFAPAMPPAGVAVCWSALSIVAAIGLTYHVVIRKVLRQYMLKSGELAAGINGGRFFCLFATFVGAAVLLAGLIFESPKWGVPEWLVAAAAIPLYLVVYELMSRLLAKQMEQPFVKSRAILASGLIVGVLLCGVYVALCCTAPVPTFASVTEAYLAAPQPFADSPSALLAEVGKLVAVVDGAVAYGQSVAGTVSFTGYLVWKIVISASAFFGIASLLGVCVLELRELKLVFLPIEAAVDSAVDAQPVKRFVILACALPILLVGGFLAAEHQTAEAVQTEEYTAIEQIVRDNVGLVAYVLDGKYYDQQEVEALEAHAHELSAELAAERETTLTPLINAAYDQRVENVDAYLDWYYSLPADYERLIQFFTGTVEDGLREQLTQRLNEGVDSSELEEKFNYYLEQSTALQDNLMDELHKHEVHAVPEWLIVETQPLEENFFSEPLAPTQQFLDASQRMGLSAGVGVVTGVIAKKAAQKVLGKPFFKKIVAGLLEKLAFRGLLAEGGTAIAPGVGTVIGIAAGSAVDFLFLKADEALNRESYHDEIVAAIEESRQELLEAVRAQ